MKALNLAGETGAAAGLATFASAAGLESLVGAGAGRATLAVGAAFPVFTSALEGAFFSALIGEGAFLPEDGALLFLAKTTGAGFLLTSTGFLDLETERPVRTAAAAAVRDWDACLAEFALARLAFPLTFAFALAFGGATRAAGLLSCFFLRPF